LDSEGTDTMRNSLHKTKFHPWTTLETDTDYFSIVQF
jgi:hypothetical protein